MALRIWVKFEEEVPCMKGMAVITVIVLFSVIFLSLVSPATAGEISDFIAKMREEEAKEMEKFDLSEILIELFKSITEPEYPLIVVKQEQKGG